ncbi:MAG: leucine-rich repeat domain-containing protein [Dysgonamonadaceae bacterium]|jgi:hypothetical protein|nr:leucine-rich repeat domain-containing protein [Dysgonamonadaceae bacterium]
MKKYFVLICLSMLGFAVNAQNYDDLCCPQEGEDAWFVVNTMEDALDNPDLTILDLSLQTPKLTEAPDALSQFTNLQCLDLSFNRVGKFYESFKKLTNLRCLNLSGNHYLQKIPEFFAEMPALKYVRIEGLNWSAAKRAQTEKDFPNITFIW